MVARWWAEVAYGAHVAAVGVAQDKAALVTAPENLAPWGH